MCSAVSGNMHISYCSFMSIESKSHVAVGLCVEVSNPVSVQIPGFTIPHFLKNI